ncbi:uncharacterized protein [Typha latifolia]|uniref:uncharacterized protein n=1 Tax=Typha latifolia TaxID=4733 RepID=UPI003C2E0728
MPMEFRFRAGEQRFPPFPSQHSAADGYFAAQAMRAGLVGGNMMQPMTALEAVEREIRKERIREEILREEAERRILEEEVRRELEVERLMGMRRMPETFVEPLMMPIAPNVRVMDGLGFGQVSRGSLDASRRMSEEKAFYLAPNKAELQSNESPPSAQVQPVKQKVSGSKRKSNIDLGTRMQQKQVKMEWCCALCQVSATNESGLNEHLQGKRHKAKLAQSEANGTTKNNVAFSSKKAAKGTEAKDMPSGEEAKKITLQVDGKMHEVLQSKKFLWCEKCQVKSPSTINMVLHLSGKKHNNISGDGNKTCKSRNAIKGSSLEKVEEPKPEAEKGMAIRREEQPDELNKQVAAEEAEGAPSDEPLDCSGGVVEKLVQDVN